MTAQVHHVPDSAAWLRSAPSKAVDVIITDPPYTPHVHDNLCSGSLVGSKAVPKYELSFPPLVGGNSWLVDALRVARRWVITFCAVEDFGRIEDTVGRRNPNGKKGQRRDSGYVRGCIWYKPNSMGQLSADRPSSCYEGIAALHPEGQQRWNGHGSYGMWRCNGTRGKKGRHPNEKPMDLCRKLVALFSDRGESVLDPFAGSGAIGQACVELGRHYVGLDNDPEWVAKANERLQRTAPDGSLYTEAWALCSMRGDDPPMPAEDMEEAA